MNYEFTLVNGVLKCEAIYGGETFGLPTEYAFNFETSEVYAIVDFDELGEWVLEPTGQYDEVTTDRFRRMYFDEEGETDSE